jgi:adenylate cyclase
VAEDEFKRKLTAILSADVKGYSRLMGEDEEATVRTLTAHRAVIATVVHKHGGRVVDSPGDNILAQFASVVDAVRVAVEIQEELKVRNAELPENRRMRFRIGVNLGDVIHEEERIYGDGVNVAARVESLADPGGICISRSAYDQVKNKLSLSYEYLGEHSVKNITEPVRIYRIGMDAAVTEVSRELKLPEKPSIAVLPFVNMSGDPEQEYFSDGITEDLITDLSKISSLLVIARNSVFTYKGKAVKIGQVGRELGVLYVLEGSVRKVGNRVRITAQLVDANTEGHLWAERYDRDLEDIFGLQDEVTQKIVAALAVTLTEEEEDRLARKYTGNVEAYDCFLRGLEYQFHPTKEKNIQAQRMFEKAIELDSEFAAAYAQLGRTHVRGYTHMWSQDPKALDRAFDLAQKARDLDDSLPEAYFVFAQVYYYERRHEQAIAELEKAITLSPNYADAVAELGDVLNFVGRPEEAIELIEKALRFNPTPPSWYLDNLGRAYLLTKRYEEAVATFKRVINRNPDYWVSYVYLAASYADLGRQKEAQAVVAEVQRINPMLSLESCRQLEPFKEKAVLDRFIDALCRAGLK